MLEVRKIGVIGAGQMGNGIAQVAARAGIEVALNDISAERIEAGIAAIGHNLDRMAEKGQIDAAERAANMARLHPAPTYDAFGDCDLVIEAATENEELKRKIFSALVPKVKADALEASFEALERESEDVAALKEKIRSF